jgi:hypothetical protein
MRRYSQIIVTFVASLPLLVPPLHAATATWLSATSGTWSDAARWSTNPDYPNSPSYESSITPTGSPYTVTATGTIHTGRTNLISPDAALDLAGTSFSAAGGLYISPGTTARLRSGELYNTSVHGPLLLDPLTTSTPLKLRSVTLTDADLRTAFGAAASALTFDAGLTLNNATVRLSNSPRTELVGSISGTGTVLAENAAGTSLTLFLLGTGTSTTVSIAPGISFRTVASRGSMAFSGQTAGLTLNNAGTISAEAPGTRIVVPQSVNLSNAGTLAASNGGHLQAYVAGDTGTLRLGPGGGSILLHGPAYNVTRPVHVPAGAQLGLRGGWQNSSTITVDGGALSLYDGSPRPGALAFLNDATLSLHSPHTPASVKALGVNAGTRVVMRDYASLDLGNAPLDFWTLPGQWSFSSADASIRNGTLLTGFGGGGRLTSSPDDALQLYNVTVDFPLDLDRGSLAAAFTTFTKPVSLSGTGRLVLGGAVNTPAGVTAASGGTIAFAHPPGTSLGPVSLSRSGTLEFDYNTTFGEISTMLATRPGLTPGTVAIGPGGHLGLDSFSLPTDLANPRYTLALVAGQSGPQSGARLTNGTLTDSSGGLHPLRVYAAPGYAKPEASLTEVYLSAVTVSVASPATLVLNSGTRLERSRVTGDGTLDIRGSVSVTLSNAALDTPTRLSDTARVEGVLTLSSTLTINSTVAHPIASRLYFEDNASLAGTATLTFAGVRNTSGAIHASSPLTIPAGITLKSTYVNSLVSAPALTVQGPLLLEPGPDADPALPTLTIRAPATRIDSPLSLSAGRLVLETTTTRLTAPLTLTDAATLDLRSSLLLLDPATVPSPDSVRVQLLAGRLTSSLATADQRLAYIPLSLLPPTQAHAAAARSAGASPAALVLTLALPGDANVDGALDAGDYAILDRSHARSPANARWTDGDFNYDGAVNAQDYLLIDTGYALQSGPLSADFLARRESEFGRSYVSNLLANVPEPSLAAAAAAGVSIATRSRRRRRG